MADAVAFGLSAAALAQLRRVMASHPAIRRALVYGSRAKGNYRPGSDIDLVLDAPALSFAEFLQIEQALDDLLLPQDIDLALLHHIESADLLDHIQRIGQPLYLAP